MLVVDHLHTGHSRGYLLCKVWGFLPLRFIIPLPSFPSYAFSLLPTRPFSQHQVHLRSIQKFVKMYHDLRRSTLLSLKTLILKHCIQGEKGGWGAVGGIKEEVRGRDVVGLIWHNGFILCSLHGITYQLVQPFIMFHLLSHNTGINTKYTFQNKSRSLL